MLGSTAEIVFSCLTRIVAARQSEDGEEYVLSRDQRDGTDSLKKSPTSSGARYSLLLYPARDDTGNYSTSCYAAFIIGKVGHGWNRISNRDQS